MKGQEASYLEQSNARNGYERLMETLGTEFQFGVVKEVLKMDTVVVTVAQQCGCT